MPKTHPKPNALIMAVIHTHHANYLNSQKPITNWLKHGGAMPTHLKLAIRKRLEAKEAS